MLLIQEKSTITRSSCMNSKCVIYKWKVRDKTLDLKKYPGNLPKSALLSVIISLSSSYIPVKSNNKLR